MKKKIYLSPENRRAPHGPYICGGAYEHEVCCEIAEYEKQALERSGFEVIIARPDYQMSERVAQANRLSVDFYQTIHTNAGGGTGAECLYFNHPESIRANQCIYDELVKLYPSKRGIRDYSDFYENRMTKMVSVYPELGFHDNEKDAEFLLSHKKEYGEALCRGVCAYFGVSYVTEDEINYQDRYEMLKRLVDQFLEESAQYIK